MLMNLPRSAFSNLIGAITVTLSLVPGVSLAQGAEPAWVSAALAGLIRNCAIPASQLSLRWDADASTLRVEASPTLSQPQQQCIVTGFKNATVKIEGLPNVPQHFTHPTR
jgi:hypothetical protein